MANLTLSMIVKNEEKHLANCLDSVKDVADEIIIVDTGSTDKTVEIANRFGAKVYQFEWINDFSAARNYALRKSTGKWILYLDADERLDEKSIQKIKSQISSDKNHGVRCKIYNVDEINKKPKFQSYTRLFKNSTEIEFRGRAHEQIDNSLIENNYRIVESDILIHHFGYNISRDGIIEKAKRNLELLLTDYKFNPNGYTAFQIANSYNILYNNRESFRYFSFAINDKNLPHEYCSLALSNIAEFHLRANNIHEALNSINKSLEYDPLNITANLTASEIYFKLKKGSEAVSFCINAYEENKKRSVIQGVVRLIDIYYDEEMILYHGLNIAYQSNEQTGIEYFFNNLEDIKTKDKLLWQRELDIIQHISSESVLSFENINFISGLINENNLNFYLGLLKHYNHKDIKQMINKKLYERFTNNLVVRNQYAHDLSEASRIDEAISVYQTTLEKFPDDTSVIFYLISLYLNNNDFHSLESLILSSKENHAENKLFIERLKEFEEKLSSIKQNIN